MQVSISSITIPPPPPHLPEIDTCIIVNMMIYFGLNSRKTNSILKPGFHMIIGDYSRSLGSLVNCSAIVMIIWKPNFDFASDHQ